MPGIQRSKNELMIRILEICKRDDASRNEIVRNANMNFDTVKPYLDQLTKNGLLEAAIGNRVNYRTTRKGEEALDYLREIEKYLLSIPIVLGIKFAFHEVLSRGMAAINEIFTDGFVIK